MTAKELNQLISQIENHIECWKQFNHFVNVARGKKFNSADESHFLEIKSVIAQELELIFAAVEVTTPSRDDVISLVGHAPSLRYLGEMSEGELRGIESQWHKIYIGWHSILGQLKVKQRVMASKTFSFWGRKK
jgi:hypothetical protein